MRGGLTTATRSINNCKERHVWSSFLNSGYGWIWGERKALEAAVDNREVIDSSSIVSPLSIDGTIDMLVMTSPST
jgi:hypothetical protein